jgi:hypothetical protein
LVGEGVDDEDNGAPPTPIATPTTKAARATMTALRRRMVRGGLGPSAGGAPVGTGLVTGHAPFDSQA